MLEGLKTKFSKKCKEVNEIQKCVIDEKYISNKLGEGKTVNIITLEREELIRRARGLSKEDWEILIGEAPIEICYNRIGKELKEAKEFRKSIGNAVHCLKDKEED